MRGKLGQVAWQNYVYSIGLVALASILGRPFSPSFDHANLVMFYLLAEVLAAIYLGFGPSIVAALTSVIAFHTFFVLPHFVFSIDEAQYLLTLSGLLIVGLVVSALTAKVRQQAQVAQERERQISASYNLSRTLAQAEGVKAICEAIARHVWQVFARQVIIFLPDQTGALQIVYQQNFEIEPEFDMVSWSFQQGQPAGRGTANHAEAQLRYHPLKTAQGVVGVLGITPPPPKAILLTPEQHDHLETFASQAAIALERLALARQAQQTELLRETEKLQTALLNSISHDLRTPLASITGTLSSLHADGHVLDEALKRELVDNALEEANRLNRLVANLLDMTRLQAGRMKVIGQPCDVQDLVGIVLAELDDRLRGRQVMVTIPAETPLILADFVLMSRVLINLLENAGKYAPPSSPIDITVRAIDAWVEIEVADRGMGIPAAELERIFDKFYRVPRPDGVGGTGLGLSICKGIVEAHGGRIWAAPRQGGGTRMMVALPTAEA